MVSPLFGINVAKLIADNFRGQLNVGTLTVITHGARTNSTSGRSQSPANSTFDGLLTNYKDEEVDGTLVEEGDRKVLIIAGTLNPVVIPKSKDRVTIEGVEFEIKRVMRDPAAATYTLQVRGG